MRKLSLTLVCCLLLTSIGCGKTSTEVQSTSNLTYAVDTEAEVNANKAVQYGYSDLIPITKDGTIYGYARINQLEKVGISDWSNATAQANQVSYSYSINLTVNFSTAMKNKLLKDSDIVNCKPTIVKGSKTVGVPCNVGWTGFATSATVYSGDARRAIEVGIQPNISSMNKCKIQLQFYNGKTNFDKITLAHSVLKHAVKGPSILKKNQSKTITALNGAKYSVQIMTPYKEINIYENSSDGGKLFYMFKYKTTYLTKPTKKQGLTSFDTFANGLMLARLVIGVQSDIDFSTVYDEDANAMRALYSDSGSDQDYEYYDTSGNIFLKTGHYALYSVNREVPETTYGNPTYLRFSVEFPEEQEARSTEEMLKFNGRFTVFQIKIGKRKLLTQDQYEARERAKEEAANK